MFGLKRRKDRGGGAAVATPERIEDDPGATLDDLTAELERLSAANRATPDREAERRLLALRHRIAMRLVDDAEPDPEHPAPAASLAEADELPEVDAADLTPELLRAGILRDGCLLVRGLVPRADALTLAQEIDRAFAERERIAEGVAPAEGYYEEFAPDSRFETDIPRPWVMIGGGLLAGDAPKLAFQMFELFRQAGLHDLVRGYLGEPPLISLQKTTLRKADPSVGGAWHQDGAFMGDVRSVNLWLSLSRCGDEAPGLDVVPRRLEEVVATDAADRKFEFEVTDEVAARLAEPKRVLRPIFEPGDAMFFDHLFLHRTASDAAMPNPRFAVENWFFGPSGFPADYAPIAV